MAFDTWSNNNGCALQDLLCGRAPGEPKSRVATRATCDGTSAAEICRISPYTFRRYVNDDFPQSFRDLGLTAAPQPLNLATRNSCQQFDLEAVRAWAEKFNRIRARAEAELKKKKSKSRTALTRDENLITIKDIAKTAGVSRSTLQNWFKHGLPEKLKAVGAIPKPSYVFANAVFYQKSVLEWAKALKEVIAGVSEEVRQIRRITAEKATQPKRRNYPDLISRAQIALMIGVPRERLNAWVSLGMPKSLKECGCPDFPKSVDVISTCAQHRIEEIGVWVLAYKKACRLAKQRAEELEKVRAERRRNHGPQKQSKELTAQLPDVSDLGFEVVCMHDASRLLGFDRHRVSKIYCLGVSQRMRRKGVPEFPPVVCRRRGFSFFKKSDIEAWGREFRKAYPGGIVRKKKIKEVQNGTSF